MEGAVDTTTFLNDWLRLVIDGALIVGIFCLWLTWYRNGKRQQQMEQLLIGTAQQLEEATMHLSLATSAIEQIQQQEEKASAKQIESVIDVAKERATTNHAAEAPVRNLPPQNLPAQNLPAQSLPPQNSTQATMILRMQREGESEESIADRLDIPVAQVKLMLKLHAASRPV